MSKNKILEEQRKARQEFLELKKMQNGKIDTGPKPSEEAITPKTFSEKLQNFWYYFKWQTIAAVFLVIAIAILTVQCTTKEKYDFKVIYFAFESVLDPQLDKIEQYIESFATDLNGDGKKNVMVINCSFNSNSKNITYRNSILTKVQAIITTGDDTIMYIVDESSEKHLNNIIKEGIFHEPPIALNDKFYSLTKHDEMGELPKGLKIGNRKIVGTLLEKKDSSKIVFNECNRILKEIVK